LLSEKSAVHCVWENEYEHNIYELSAEDAKYKAEIEKISTQIAHEIELMRKEREEFERSSVSTDAMIDQLLVQLGMR